MAEKRTLPPLTSFFKPAQPVSDADPALANIPEIDWANNDSMDVAASREGTSIITNPPCNHLEFHSAPLLVLVRRRSPDVRVGPSIRNGPPVRAAGCYGA